MSISGAVYYLFSLFFKPLELEFGWSRGTISVAFAIYFVMQAMAAPFVGRLVDRYGPRNLIALGAVIIGLGFLWLSLLQNLWSFYGGYLVIGLGATASGPISASHAVSGWFSKRRGLAVGLMAMGIGAGAIVFVPIFGSYLIPNFGWRASYLTLSMVIWLLIIPATLLVIKPRPPDIAPHGVEISRAFAMTTLSPPVERAWTLSMALKTPTFWLIAVAFIIANFSHTGAIQHQVNHLTDIGFPANEAAIALGAVGLGSGIGKFFFGWLCDRIPAKHATTISFVLQLAAVVILVTLKSTSPPVMIWLYAILMGVGSGGWLPTMSLLISSNFGLVSYGAIFGTVSIAQNFGTGFGPLVAGQMFDYTQTYSGVMLLLVALYTVVAIPAVLAVRRPKSSAPSSI